MIYHHPGWLFEWNYEEHFLYFLMKKKGKHNENKGGVVVRSNFLRKDQMRLSYNNTQTHNLVIGTTGSGKTQSYILPSILSIADSDASMVINDPKGELCQKTSEYPKRKGYRVFVMDYFQPLAGTCFNQLFMVKQEYDEGLPHFHKAKAIESILKTIDILISDGDINNLEMFKTVHFNGSRSGMPSRMDKAATKGRFTNSTAGYDIFLIDPTEDIDREFGISDIDSLVIKLEEIYGKAEALVERNFRKKNASGLEEHLYHNEYLHYRELKVLEEAKHCIDQISKENWCQFLNSKLKDAQEILSVADRYSSAYKQSLELKVKYESAIERDVFDIDALVEWLKDLKSDHEDKWIDHETSAVTKAGSIATMLVGKDDKGDRFWSQTAISMQKSLILMVCRESHLPYSKHLGSVNRMLANLFVPDEKTGKTEFDAVIDRFSDSDIVKVAMSEVRVAPDKTKGSILASASVATGIFGDYSVADQGARSDFDPETLVNDKTAVFLVSPGNDDAGTAQYTILSTLFIEETYSALNRMLSQTEEMTLPRAVYFLLDEIANIPPIPELGSKISLARSKNIRLSLVIQSYEQLKQHYRDSYDTIRENSNILYILSNNTGTAKEISERIGKTTIEINSISSSARDNGNAVSTSTSTAGRDLFTPQEIMQMKEGSALYMMQRQQPYLTHLEPVWKWPICKWLDANRIPNIHIRRHRQEVNYFCPDPDEFSIAYESLDRGIILDRYVYEVLSKSIPVTKEQPPKLLGKVFDDELGNKC